MVTARRGQRRDAHQAHDAHDAHDTHVSDDARLGGAPPTRGSRIATAALVIAFLGVLFVLFVTDRVLARSADDPRLRVAIWVVGLAALGALVVGLAHERRLTR